MVKQADATVLMVFRKVRVDGREIELSISGDGTFRAGTRTGRFDAVQVEPGVWSVVIDGASHTVFTGPEGGYLVDQKPVRVQVVDPRVPLAKSSAVTPDGVQTLKASMSGRVLRILVSDGAQVEAGQTILVVEAMKMQNKVTSPKSGTLLQVRVREGDTVGAGDLLAVVE